MKRGDAEGPLTGELLDGKYLVGRVIGEGAVGVVYEARDVELDEAVVIEGLRPEMLADEAMVRRFAREARAAATIESEYVATIRGVGATPDGAPFLVMEHLDGKDLGSIVSEAGPLAPRTAVEYALQVCEALAVAHAKGIVHRAIEPENLLLTERAGGRKAVKVLDFGISKAAPRARSVNLMGTPLYMSPEQVRVTDSVDVRSDVWSLGMVLYEMLAGQPAFDGQSVTEICAQILEAEPRPMELLRDDLPSGLVEVVARCLQKDVTMRYQNVAELALALMPFGPKRGRLNVERAVAALQGAGQLPADMPVNSTMPPAPSDFMYTPIPKGTPVPTDIAVLTTPSNIPSAYPSRPVSTYALPAEKRTSPFGIILGVLAVVAVVVGALAATYQGSSAAPAPSMEPEAGPPHVKTPVSTVAPAPTTAPSATHSGAASRMAPPPAVAPSKPAATSEEPDLGY